MSKIFSNIVSNTIKILLFYFLSIAQLFSLAQSFERFDYLPVSINGNTLQYPWTGGLGAVLFGNADVNNDGKNDVVVYDKTNQKYCIFLTQETNSTRYSYERKYAENFPPINGWLQLIDYNCDGIVDLFTGNDQANIKVYTGFYQNDTLKFKLQQDGFFYNNGINVYAVDVLKPAIADINKDGDIDIIGFNVSGNRLIYYENQQRELSLSCDSLVFKKTDNCWGNVRDTFASSYSLRDTCSLKFGLRENNIQHTGSTIEAIDADGNGAMDLLIGSVSLNNITMLYNFGNTTYSSVLKQDITYPTYNIPYDVSSFASSYFIDANNDNRKDLLVSNFDVTSSNINNIWYYKNISNDSMKLVLQQKNFLLDNTIDAGENSNPCFFDVDGDGLKDILLGSGGYKFNLDPTISKLQFYKNIGTPTYPKFDLFDDDFLNISTLNVKDIVPAVGDIDNDGDSDLVIGISDGRMLYWENIATLGNPPNLIYKGILKNNSNVDINVGANATPYLVDLNRDGKTDLVIGERNGNINYYKGTSNNSAQFFLETDSLGKIKIRTISNNIGYSQPVIKDINNDGKYDLILGTNLSGLLFYNNIEDSINARFLSSSPIVSDKLGYRTTSTIEDITNDGKLELLTGNISGGLIIFSENPPPFIPTIIKNNLIEKLDFNVFPNPSNNQLFINIDKPKSNILIQIFNSIGQEIINTKYITEHLIEINTSQLSNGFYLIKITYGESEGLQKIVVNHL